MIYCLTGELIYLDALTMTAVIDCGGVGYKLTVTGNTLSKLNSVKNDSVRLFTYMAVREDAVELYGFYTTDELDTFRLLISVSGVGPKAAISILSVMTPQELAASVAAEDAKALSKAPGIGGKTAARIVLELKDKLARTMPGITVDKNSVQSARVTPGRLSDARDALLVLGYSRTEVQTALSCADPAMETEDIIRFALSQLMK